MTADSGSSPDADARRLLDGLLAAAVPPTAANLRTLGALPAEILERTLGRLADDHGAAAVPVLTALASAEAGGAVRRAARRALYRLAQRGVTVGGPAPVVARQAERASRAWLSGIDGSGSRAVWLLFEGPYGALRLCSLILNDVSGILDVAGGDITKKRLGRELADLRASQKLPWVEMDPARPMALVAEARALHHERGTAPPPAFARWAPLFVNAVPAPPELPAAADAALVERSASLLELPELAGWFLDPETIQGDAVELLQARESRLVVSDQIKAERQEAIVSGVVEREFTEAVLRLWARRLTEMALVFEAIDRHDHAELARAAGVALRHGTPEPRRHPFARALAARALEVAGEVALGRLSAAQASRKPTAR